MRLVRVIYKDTDKLCLLQHIKRQNRNTSLKRLDSKVTRKKKTKKNLGLFVTLVFSQYKAGAKMNNFHIASECGYHDLHDDFMKITILIASVCH